MGNICFGGAEEKKADAFGEASHNDATDLQSNNAAGEHYQQQQFQQQQQQQYSQDAALQQQGLAEPASSNDANNININNNNVSTATSVTPAEQKAADERFKAAQEEQARLELIVQATGRGMVPVRSQRGSTSAAYCYQDQGFAAALAQHLEQTTQFPERLAVPLPPPAGRSQKKDNNNNGGGGDDDGGCVYACLAQPEWEGIALGNKDGENPVAYMDHVAEQCLDSAIPKKERLFANVSPIVENLL